MASKKQRNAEDFLDQVFSAAEKLENIFGPDLAVKDILKAAEKQGFKFDEDDLRKAIKKKLEDREIPLARYCFSESPCA